MEVTKEGNKTTYKGAKAPEPEFKKRRKQTKSMQYAIKAVINHVDTISKGGYVTEAEVTEMKKIVRSAVEKYLKEEYGL